MKVDRTSVEIYQSVCPSLSDAMEPGSKFISQSSELSKMLHRNSNIFFVLIPVYEFMYVEILPQKWSAKRVLGTDILTWWVKNNVNYSLHNTFSLLFAARLLTDERERTAAAAWQKSIGGLRYLRSRARSRYSNLIEKRWVNELKNCQNRMVSHVSFCVAAMLYSMRAGDGSGAAKISLWASISQITRSHQEEQFNWKTGEWMNCKNF